MESAGLRSSSVESSAGARSQEATSEQTGIHRSDATDISSSPQHESAVQSPSRLPPGDTLRQASIRAYHGPHGRTFHGGDEDSQASIHANGFKEELKTPGGAGAEEVSEEGHFLTDSMDTARLYGRARAAVTGKKPTLTRAIGVQELPHGEMQKRRNGNWYVAAEDIGLPHVLPFKNEPIHEGTAKLFQTALEHEGYQVSEAVAAEELEEVRSDSGGDFQPEPF